MSWKRYAVAITGFFEILCVGGTIMGWSSMEFILTNEEFFNSSCKKLNYLNSTFNETTKHLCKNQKFNLELIYTLSLIIWGFGSLVLGAIMDRFGTRILRHCSALMYIISCLVIAFTNQNSSWLLYPGFIGISVAGIGLYASNVQISNLFDKSGGLVVNLLYGAYIGSIGVFACAKTFYQIGTSLRDIFIFLSAIGILIIIRTYFLMPKTNISDDNLQPYSNNETQSSQTEISRLVHEETISTKKYVRTELKSSILNSVFLLAVFSGTVITLRQTFFIEELNSMLFNWYSKRPNFISLQLNVFGYLQIFGIVFMPLFGKFYDLLVRHFSQKLSLSQAKLRSLSITCLSNISFTILYSIFTLISSPVLQYFTYCLIVLSYPANLELLIIQCFPDKYFGTLYGIALVTTGLSLPIQYGLYYIALRVFKGSFTAVNIFVLGLSVTILIHPINLYRCSKKATNY